MQPTRQPSVPDQSMAMQQPSVDPNYQQPTAQPMFAAAQPIIQPVPTSALMPTKKVSNFADRLTEIILGFLLVCSLGFGIWAFVSRTDYKSNSDKKSAAAVAKAAIVQKAKSDLEYAEKDKLPLVTYSSPAVAGSIKMQYPKSWSAYVTEESNSSSPVVGYFHPGFVPNTLGIGTAFALRLEVANNQYAELLKQYESNIKSGTVSMSPYSLPGVPSVLGAKLSGQIVSGNEKVVGTIVLMPVRDKTIKIWTESNTTYLADFENSVLANFTFVP